MAVGKVDLRALFHEINWKALEHKLEGYIGLASVPIYTALGARADHIKIDTADFVNASTILSILFSGLKLSNLFEDTIDYNTKAYRMPIYILCAYKNDRPDAAFYLMDAVWYFDSKEWEFIHKS